MPIKAMIYGFSDKDLWAALSTMGQCIPGPFVRERDEVGKVARILLGSSMSNTQWMCGRARRAEKKGVRMFPRKNKVKDKGNLVHKVKMSPLTKQARESG